MNTLTVVFTGLVFYATPPTDPGTDAKFTNAVLVTGNSPHEHHSAKLMIPAKADVTVRVGNVTSDKRTWTLGRSSWVTLDAGNLAPQRTPEFEEHVPSIGKALLSAFPNDPDKRGTLAPCTYAEKPTSDCRFQQGRVHLSGGTLDAYVPDPNPVYTFKTDSLRGEHKSKLSHKTTWKSELSSFLIYDDGKTYTVTLNAPTTVLVSSEPSHEGRHIGVLRELYGLGNNGVEADFPRPMKDASAFERFLTLARESGLPSEWSAHIRTLSRPIICPPATQ